MPCYQTQNCTVELNNADTELLEKALKEERYQTNIHPKTKQLSFSKGQVVGYYRDNNLHIEAPEGTEVDTNAIKRSYSRQVVEKQAAAFKAKGWKTRQEGKETVFYKPQQQQQQTVGIRR